MHELYCRLQVEMQLTSSLHLIKQPSNVVLHALRHCWLSSGLKQLIVIICIAKLASTQQTEGVFTLYEMPP